MSTIKTKDLTEIAEINFQLKTILKQRKYKLIHIGEECSIYQKDKVMIGIFETVLP